MTLSDEAFAELRAEFNRAAPALWAGEPDRTDFMIPLNRLVSQWTTMDKIVQLVAHETGVAARAIKGPSKTQKICRARHLATFIASEIGEKLTDAKLSKIVGRDRSTITHSVKRAAQIMDSDSAYKASYKRVVAGLGINAELVD